jgi:anaerobic selenocysteine-containing dehydrogenase
MTTKEMKTICPYCGVGCGLIATTDGRQIVRIRGDKDHPANFGKICPKGATVAQTVNVSTRLRYAMLREQVSDHFQLIPNGAAVLEVSQRLGQIRDQHGPGAIALYLSGQLTTEAQYIANKFAKGCLGTNHVDSNSRLCMASAASGMSLSLGSDGPPTCYADIDLADTFLFIGSNAAECHPVVFERVLARMRAGARAIVVDPRRTATAEQAFLHLPVRPGTDLALLNGLLRILRDWNKLDGRFISDRTEGWEALNELLDQYAPQYVSGICQIRHDDLISAARIIADSKRFITFWTMGVNQSIQGTFNVNAIINLHLATGRIGRPGCGPFSLTGQPNAMGGRDVGYMSHTLPGQRFIANPEHRAQMESFWNIPPGSIAAQPGYDAVRMFDAIDRGEIKAIWIVGSNPAASMPNLPKIKRALEKCELVIAQDGYYPTETTRFAHVILPAAVNLEQEGTFCNSERRVSVMEKVTDPPGQAMPDWWWFREVGRSMGFDQIGKFASAELIFDEFVRSTAGRPNDQSGMYYALLRKLGPQQWPMPAMGQSRERRYLDQRFPTQSGKAKFWARPHSRNDDERTNSEFPLILTTSRELNQWHTRTKTGLVAQLNQQSPGPFVQIHPDDARHLELKPGQQVSITSRRGQARSIVRIDAGISPGVVCMPIHWNDLFGSQSSPNEAASDQTDPISKEPALKCCAVMVGAINGPPRTIDESDTVIRDSPADMAQTQ